MIDLSFLTDEEQEAILKVLQRDAELKRAEEERIRHLPEKVKDDNQIKNMSGQWFYETKSKRHRDKIHGADIIRASMRRKPLTAVELNQNKSGKKKNSWVNNVNKEVFMPPELFGAIDDTEGELKSNPSPAVFNTDSSSLAAPQEDTKTAAASPSKERKNPFNSSNSSEDDAKSKHPEHGTSCSSEASKKENQSEGNITNSRLEEPQSASLEPNEPPRQAGKPPVPKARRNVHKTSDVSVNSEDSFPKVPRRIKQSNGQGTPPRGILKRNSSSSSTDSEVLRLNQIVDSSHKNGLPTSTIREGIAEKNGPPGREPDGFSQNSLDKLKQVRFSSSVSRKERPASLELHEGKESGEFSLLDSDYVKTSDDQASGLDICQNEQTPPVKPLAFHSTDLNGHTEDEAASKGPADPCSYNTNGSGLPSDVLQPQKSPPAECRTSSETFPKDMKEPSADEMKPEIKTGQRSSEPDVSQSSTGQQLPLANTGDSQAPSVVSVDLEQGKPVLVDGPSAKTPSKSDRHAAEALKAADESITKVLDWFKRSSSTDSEGNLPSSVSQEREPSEGMNMTKTRGLAVTRDENASSRDVLNQDATLHISKELTKKDPRFQDGGNQPQMLPLAQTGYPNHLLLGEQKLNSQSNGEMADLSDQRFAHLQINGQGTNKADETYFLEGADGESKTESENSACRETKVDEGVKPSLSVDTLGKERQVKNSTLGDGKRNVKSYVKEGKFEHQAGVLLEEPEVQESSFLKKGQVQQDVNVNRGNLLRAQQQEIKQSSPTGDQKKIKDIRAFWEREQTSPKLGSKEDAVNEKASVKKVMHSCNKGTSQVKPTSKSSGYVMGESDNEQDKYNLVAFRRVELSDDSEPKDNDINLSLGNIRPEPVDKSKGECVIIRDWKSTEFTKSLDADKLQPRHDATYSSKKDGGLPIGDLAKDRTASAPQPKSNFTIHSLKQKADEESKSEMLNPSQFQSLRSFWNVGVKPQSRTDEPKEKSIPGSNSVGTCPQQSQEIKGLRVGTGQAVLQEEQKSPITQGFLKATPNQPRPPLLANVVPTESLQCVPKEDSCLEEPSVSQCMETKMRSGNEVKEYIEKTVVPSKMQPSLFKSGLQKLLTQTSQDSLPVDLPADEGGAPKETEGQKLCTDYSVQRGAVSADTDSNVGLSTNEIAETIHRTLVPPKVDTDSFSAGLERLRKEASEATPFSNCSITASSSKQPTSPLEEISFYNKVMQLSHDAYPSGQTHREVAPQNLEKGFSISGQQVRFETSEGDLPKEIEELNPVPQRALKKEGNQMYRDDISSREKVLQIPSPEQILPDARLAVMNRAKLPGKEISETVTESSVPLKRESHDLNTRLLRLLKEPSERPSVSRATESISTTAFEGIPGEDQQRSYRQVMEASALPSPPMTTLPRQTSSETTEKSDDTFSGMQRAPNGEAAMGLPFVNQKSVGGQSGDQSNGDVTSVGQLVEPQPEEVAETVVRTVKPKILQQTRLKDSLKKLLKEDSEVLCKDIEFPKPVHASLQPNQSVNSVDDKSVPPSQEIHEFIEKATVPSNPVYGDLKINFQKLLMKDMESLPSNQQSTNGNRVERMTNKESETLVSQQEVGQQEIKETVNKTVVPPKLQQSELNSGLQKLFAEVSHMSSDQLQQLGGKTKEKMQATEETVDVFQDSVVKSIPPADDTVFNSCSGKLMKKNSDASSHLSKDSIPEVPDDSTYQSESGSLLVPMPALLQKASNDYRTEVRIPLKGKSSKQDGQVLADAKISVVPGQKMLFQKTVQVNLLSTEAPLPGKEEGSPTLARAEEREMGYDRERNAGEVSRSSVTLDSGSEDTDVPLGSQRASTPLVEQRSPPTISQVELLLASRHDEDEEDEDARSFGSDLSNESISSLSGIKRSSICSEEEPNPVLEALKRSSNRQIPSKSLEDIPSATSNKGKVNTQKEELMLSAEDGQKAGQPHELRTTTPGISTAPSFPVNQFSNPEKVKRMSKSVPASLQEESDDRETDTASDSSYPLGRIKKSPSSLTNLSGSSGLASLSSVSTSVMSVYSGDFGNVDVKGNIQFAIDYVEQLKELHVFIAQCKDLAVADIKKQRSDPYVKSYLLPEKYKLGKRKTSVKKKTLNPVYNEILRYKVDKALLTSQRLNISVWHNDIFGRNSFLGEVELNLGMWDWNDKQNKQMIWYPLKPRAPLAALELENRGEMKLALQYVPEPAGGKKTPATGEVHIWVKECNDLPILRGNKLNSFVKCTVLPDTSRKSRQKTRAVAKTTNPVFNHTMVYDGFKPEDLKEACVELTVWDHNKLVNHFLGGLRIGLGTGKSYGTAVDWMDSTLDETSLWERMISSPDQWVEDTLPLRMLTIAKMAK
ncbi:synaptotagmin-like protein 2 isoform X2 [Eublepharis macularius]|uniref:Synaptotagmin-like protein 2 n=1 Tax=Eublepharis macularius TaxID=481883 RepID=A0AA97KS50_EUBMA|nr:synaptotagmin-like protein 2 isoform X2 [Eublepharis macularius]